nr:SMP-30/gluconolactonase/LRE family protein [Sphingomonas sp. SFZ2018-12]
MRARVGESACWSVRDQSLFSVDIWSRELWRHDADHQPARFAMPEMAACVVPADEGVLVALESHLLAGNPDQGAWRRVDAPADHPDTHRFNDACVAPDQSLVIGTMHKSHLGASPTGTLYRLAQGRWSVLATGFWTINGLAFSPDGCWLYLSDSHPEVQMVWRAPWDGGAIGPRQVFARFDSLRGRPDGATVDARGNYWIAGVGGGCVHCFDAEGVHVAEIDMPVENPTRVAVGGPALDRLYVTSMAERLTRPDPAGLAGAVLMIDGVAGGIATPFCVMRDGAAPGG